MAVAAKKAVAENAILTIPNEEPDPRRLKAGAEVDIMCSAVMYPGAFIRYVGNSYIEFDSRMGYTVLPWSAISAITFRP